MGPEGLIIGHFLFCCTYIVKRIWRIFRGENKGTIIFVQARARTII